MANKFFTGIVKDLKWLGKEIAAAPNWIDKVVTITDDVEDDAQTLCPQLVTLIGDVDALALSAVKDGGKSLAAVEALSAAVLAAFGAKGLNIPEDAAVIAAVQVFITQVTSSTTWVDVVSNAKKLIVDYDAFGAAAKAALLKLEADAKA